MENEYFASEHNRTIKKSDLSKETHDIQLDVMKTWFFANFEDPANRTPYDSSEGGYQWIWGGPYFASDELMGEFFNVVPDELIEDLASELNFMCCQWSPTEKADDYEESFIEDISTIGAVYDRFNNSIKDIRELLQLSINGSPALCFYRLLYANVITSLETYLSDTFINLVIPNPGLIRKFSESIPEFKKEKIFLSEAYKTVESMGVKVKDYLARVLWHNLDRVKKMYSIIFEVGFDIDSKLRDAVQIRHAGSNTKCNAMSK